MFQILDCSDVGTCCSDFALAAILDTTRRIFNLIQLIVPIILMIFTIIQLIKLVTDPEEKGGIKKIINKPIAAMIIFFLPILFNASLDIFPKDFSISACWKQAKVMYEVSKETPSKYKPYKQKEKKKILHGSDYEPSNQSSNDNGSSTVDLVKTKGVLAWPAPGCTIITSTFGTRAVPTAGATSDHRAIDIGCPQGSNVTAAYDGSVIVVQDGRNSDGYNGGRGYYLVLKHNVDGKLMHTQYQHLSQVLVNVGNNVKQGQVIAKSGGDPTKPGAGATTGPHLDFQVFNGALVYKQNEVNPCHYLGLSKCIGDVSADLKR